MSIVILNLKHDDRASIELDGVESHDGIPYVNSVLGGDYTKLKIDNETGKILNWIPIKIENNKFVTF